MNHIPDIDSAEVLLALVCLTIIGLSAALFLH